MGQIMWPKAHVLESIEAHCWLQVQVARAKEVAVADQCVGAELLMLAAWVSICVM